MNYVTIVAVDLAAKFSAAVLMEQDGSVLCQFDSWGMTDTDFVESVTSPFWLPNDVIPDVMIIEDLPHRLPFAALVKHVCRLQGRIIEMMARIEDDDGSPAGYEHNILFAPPSEWRKVYPALAKRGSGPELVVPVAAELGYTPPDLSQRADVKGGKAIARKVATDYCAAFLIGRWAMNHYLKFDTFEAPGTLRYGQIPHRKNKNAKASSDA